MHTLYAYSVTMIREALLALLSGGPKYGYQLKSEFEASTGAAWALNIGQVYSTLKRLERDALIVALDEDDERRARYELSAAGREELSRWLNTAVERSVATRDEVTMKVLMTAATALASPAQPIATQRTASIRVLQEATMARNAASNVADRLHLERLIVNTAAELRWLDIAEEELCGPEATSSSFVAVTGDEAEAATSETGKTLSITADQAGDSRETQ